MLEAYRLYNTFEWMTQDELHASLTGQYEANDKMRLGTALHNLLEWDDTVYSVVVDDDVYQFDDSIDNIRRQFPKHAAKEQATSKFIGDITLTGRADLITGNSVWDHKVSTKAPDADKYIHSMQWRAYLYLFNLDVFVYNVIQIKKLKGIWTVINNMKFEHYRYPNMSTHVEQACYQLSNYMNERGLNNETSSYD